MANITVHWVMSLMNNVYIIFQNCPCKNTLTQFYVYSGNPALCICALFTISDDIFCTLFSISIAHYFHTQIRINLRLVAVKRWLVQVTVQVKSVLNDISMRHLTQCLLQTCGLLFPLERRELIMAQNPFALTLTNSSTHLIQPFFIFNELYMLYLAVTTFNYLNYP